MAELVLALAKSAVEGTLNAAKSAIEEEKKLKKNMQRDLMLISDEFEMMHSFLKVSRERASDEMVRTLVRQVRNMALDVEDCIESVVLVDMKFHWWSPLLGWLPSCSRTCIAPPPTALDEAVTAIELLKSRVEAMSQRNERYMQIGDCGGPKLSEKTHQQTGADATAVGILTEARDAKKKNPRDLIELINTKTKDHDLPLQVISLWGSAGDLGVASIIEKTCDDPEIIQNFRCRAWVKLTRPFNLHEFIRSLLVQFYTNYCLPQESTEGFLKPADVMTASEAVLMKEFMTQVSNQRYLVFLEDVSSAVDWAAVRVYLPKENTGSCVVVHSQQLEVASLCVGQSHQVLELEQFSSAHSVCVFFNESMDENVEMALKMEAAKQWTDKFKVVGRDADIWSIYERDYEESDSVVQPVYGMAGVGKSYIVKHIYYNQVIDNLHNFKKFGWVDVLHPFNLRDFSWSLLLDLHSGSLQHRSSMLRIKDPIQYCRELLRQHRYFIVIDGLQSTDEWDSINAALLFEHNNNNRIFVITREESVAKYCSKSNSWNVQGLEIDDAFELFKDRASNIGYYRIDFDRAKTVLQKCGGLPQVIVAVADFVAQGWGRFEDFDDNFMGLLETHPAFGSLRGLFDWVHSYFRSCPDCLKPCIFYLSIFPVNHKIRRSRLVRRWMEEGYSRDTKARTAEENGEESFIHLCNLNMIQVPGSTLLRMPLCQVNGFIREYIISRSMEENLVFELEGHCSMNSQHTGRHLTIGSTWDRDRIVYESIDFSRLRSLTVFGRWEPFFISDKMRILQVLDLEDASSVADADLEQMVKLLPRLKFLSLRGCKEITRLPDSLGGLRQLQTLDIRHTSVVVLPRSVTSLLKLQHIRAGTTAQLDDDNNGVESPPPPTRADAAGSVVSSSINRIRGFRLRTSPRQLLPGPHNNKGGIEVPRGIGTMVALNNIRVIDVRAVSGRLVLKELKNLTKLRKLGVSGIKQENCKELCSTISGHGHLESLSLWLDKNLAAGLEAISTPPKKLKSLKLYGHVDKMPGWIKLLSSLKKLKLQLTMITQDDVDDLLKHLRNLNTLCLFCKDFQNGKLWFRGDDYVRNLWVLEIACNCRLQSVTFDSDSVMPALEVLKIRCSNVSSLEFSGIENLWNLKEVSLSGSYEDNVKQLLKSQLDDHPGDVMPVLKELRN